MEKLLVGLLSFVALVFVIWLGWDWFRAFAQNVFDKAKGFFGNLGNVVIFWIGAIGGLVVILLIALPFFWNKYVPEGQKVIVASPGYNLVEREVGGVGRTFDEGYAKVAGAVEDLTGGSLSLPPASSGGGEESEEPSESGQEPPSESEAPPSGRQPEPESRVPTEPYEVCETILKPNPVNKWAEWYETYNRGFKGEGGTSLRDIPSTVQCEAYAISATAMTKRITERFEALCQVPGDLDKGVAKIVFNGFAADAYGVHDAKEDAHLAFDGLGDWPDEAQDEVCRWVYPPTPTPSPTPTLVPIDPIGTGLPGSEATPEPSTNAWYRVKVAGLNCRKGPGTGYASYGAISKGGEVRSRPRETSEPQPVGEWKPVSWGAVKCWINTSSKYVTAIQK